MNGMLTKAPTTTPTKKTTKAKTTKAKTTTTQQHAPTTMMMPFWHHYRCSMPTGTRITASNRDLPHQLVPPVPTTMIHSNDDGFAKGVWELLHVFTVGCGGSSFITNKQSPRAKYCSILCSLVPKRPPRYEYL
jgi:hypothetical protein